MPPPGGEATDAAFNVFDVSRLGPVDSTNSWASVTLQVSDIYQRGLKLVSTVSLPCLSIGFPSR